ncbi:MAG: hypothetical protein K8R58_06865 [Bacteroidales bacterium]|nr:hypothetical protein [Bacteroidales bacterium]
MSNKTYYNIIFLTIFFSFLLFEKNYSQQWGGLKKPAFWEDWSVNLNFGETSFYGDVSFYDEDFVKKLSNESGIAFGLIGTKYINNIFSVGGHLLSGSLKGENSKSSFEASIFEYNFHGTVNFINLVFPYNNSKMFFVGYVGIGQFIFKSKLNYFDPSKDSEEQNTGVPEFVYFFGFGVFYEINDRINITGDMAIRQAQNDALDTQRKNDNYDYYTYLSIGVTYKIKNLLSTTTTKYGNKRGKYPMRKRR